MAQKYTMEFAKRGCKLAALSCDSVANHEAWLKDVMAFDDKATELSFPVLAVSLNLFLLVHKFVIRVVLRIMSWL
jgi:alkyl hydroperoxide reductase subunit AhpC